MHFRPRHPGGTGQTVLADNARSFNFTGADADRNAILRPGGDDTDFGTLTLGSESTSTTVNLNEFSTLGSDVGSTGTSDQLKIFGGLNLDANSILNLLSLADAWDRSTDTVASFDSLTGEFGTTWGLDPNYEVIYGDKTIKLAAIPEPNMFALVGGIPLTVAIRRRR